jgi:spermidine/putrescine transport system substrate-binding protein
VEKGSTLKVYTWADYISPDNIAAFEAATGVKVQVDAYASSEEALAKLRLTQGTSGYDLLVIDGSYVPQLVKNDALLPWDKARLPGLAGVSATFLGRSWDPTNTYAIPKSGGSTGWLWDSAVVSAPPTTWNEFYGHFADPAVKGRTSVIDGAPSFISSYFWGNGISDQTTNKDDYAAAEAYFGTTVLPHLKAFNSYPRADVAAGTYVLAQAFTGDARGALIDGPKTLRFALGAPKTDIYVDHWTLPKGSANPAAAHAFVEFMLDPEHAATETLYHGYFTGVSASKQFLPKDTPYLDIIFFDEGVPADRFEPAAVTEARKLSVATFERLKALASR